MDYATYHLLGEPETTIEMVRMLWAPNSKIGFQDDPCVLPRVFHGDSPVSFETSEMVAFVGKIFGTYPPVIKHSWLENPPFSNMEYIFERFIFQVSAMLDYQRVNWFW